MCGICGIVHAEPAAIESSRLLAMRDALVHRGPDDSGVHENRNVALGSRRLSILDLSANGHMPMSTPDGRYWIAYNGESYNYRDLRPSLEAKGYRFRSQTDTEVLLYLYAEEGPEMLHWLNGMFCLAVWDAVERRLFLARDRLGVKPLYYATQGGALLFASEQKALFAAGMAPRFDTGTWEELLCFRFVAGDRTPYEGVRRLLPGHYLLWHDGHIRIERWWRLSERARILAAAPQHHPAEWLRQTFDSAVDLRRISDVPVGVLLSGGLDSSCVAASLGAQHITGLASFTVRFREKAFDEGPLAREVATRWGLEHHELVLDEELLFDLVDHCSWLNDEPLVHANDPHMFAISRYAKPIVTVLLSGEGADETLGGYVRYRPLRHLRALRAGRPLLAGLSGVLPRGAVGSIASRIHKLTRMLRSPGIDDLVLYNACDVLPGDLAVLGFEPGDQLPHRRGILAEAKALYPGEPIRQAMFLDQHTFLASVLDRNDRTTMGASIECRTPFLDPRLVEGLAALPSSQLLFGRDNKPLLRQAFGARLPDAVLRHRKWGFSVPWQRHFQQDVRFREIIADLPDAAPISDGPFDRRRVRALADNYLAGDVRHHAIIRQLVFVTSWYRACVAVGRSALPAAQLA